MMADVAENEPPAQPQGPPPPEPGSGGLPALPAGGSPEPMPPGMDAEEYRRFQEFQRFQDYQRFTKGQQQTPGQQPGGLVPLQPGQPTPYGIEHHLNGMQQQLAQLTETQARIDRVVNPPTWQKILRNKWLHRLIWLVIIVLLATWGVPKLIHHYFGNDTDSAGGNASLPLPKEQSGVLPGGPHDAVADVYMFIAGNDPTQACLVFSAAAGAKFAAAAGAPNCPSAITQLSTQVTDKSAYSTLELTQLPSPQGGHMVISSCEFDVTGGPRLGTFTVTQQSQGWEITDYAAGPDPCPAPSSSVSTPPTS